MSNASSGIPLDHLRSTWGVVSERLEAFVAAWEQAQQPPSIASFIENIPAGMLRLVLIELVKADLEYRLVQRSFPKLLEDYFSEFPMLREGGIPSDLLYEEFNLRKQRGEVVEPAEYFRRFPDAATDLARLLGHGETTRRSVTSVVFNLNDVDTGQSVDDFDLLRLLGKGSFAKVFLAWQRSMHRMVALKVTATLGAEPQTLAQLDHPNIVRVFDQRPWPDRKLYFLYMTFVGGGTLQTVLDLVKPIAITERTGRHYVTAIDQRLRDLGQPIPHDSALRHRLEKMPWPILVAWVGVRLSEALDHAHSHGILHRDIKPANILLSPEGLPMLADFNVGSCTKFGQGGEDPFFGGSIGYMSPEHLEAFNPMHPRTPDSLDHRADLYSLGVTLWELLTGKRPFDLDQMGQDRIMSLLELTKDRRAGIAVAEKRIVADANVAPEIREALERSLAPDPDQRFSHAREFSQTLDACLNPEAQELRRLSPTGILAWMRRFPRISVVSLGLVPNASATALNIAYNHAAVIAQHPHAESAFFILLNVINGVFFPLGFGIVLYFNWRSLTAASQVARSSSGPAVLLKEPSPNDCRVPWTAAIVDVSCWAVAGAVWPFMLDFAVGWLPLDAHLHFLASLVMCGLMASVYTFFLLAWFSVRGLIPLFWKHGYPPQRRATARLKQEMVLNLALAFIVPMVGVVILTLVPDQGATAVGAMRWLSIFGVLGAVAMLALERKIRADLEVLETCLPKEDTD